MSKNLSEQVNLGYNNPFDDLTNFKSNHVSHFYKHY
jgi:hypothetical protein